MLRMVRRFEGVAWLCAAPTESATATSLMVTTEPGSTPIPSVAGPPWSLEVCSWAEVAESMLGQEGSVLLRPPEEATAAQVAAASVVCTVQKVNKTVRAGLTSSPDQAVKLVIIFSHSL